MTPARSDVSRNPVGLPRSSRARSNDHRPALAAFLIVILLLVLSRGNGRRSAAPPLARRLIVSADDAGMCSSVNRATIASLERGIVSSASIMSCCPAFDEFAAYASVHPEYDYGVHLTLTCDLAAQPWGPVAPVTEVSSLVDEQGHFWPSLALVAQRARIDDAERELRAQIDRARRSAIRLTHIDHHMFVLYSRPDFLELYARLAVEYALPARHCSAPPARWSQQNDRGWLDSYRRVGQRLREAGFPLLDVVESDNYNQQPAAKRPFHLQTLRDLPFGVTELVIHCADLSGAGVQPPDAERRTADTRFVASDEARQEVDRLGIQLIDWAEFQRSASSSM